MADASTIVLPDGRWETVLFTEEGNYAIVENYNTKEEAEIGHAKWLAADEEETWRLINNLRAE